MEERKFRIGVDLVKDVMFHAHFTKERIKTVATTRINDLPAAKRSGKGMGVVVIIREWL